MDLLSVADKSSRVIGVAELNRLAKELIERQLPLMWVAGEISNFMRAASGHCYFSLKDAQAQVRCVMFRHKAQLHDWKPENGMQIEVRATPSFYEARGEFQLNVEAMRRAGLGALYAAFEQLKARLSAEGLFAEERKQVLPRFPRAIGIVTSPHAAALRDVLTTLKRRMPAIPVIIYPTPVQGEGAAAKIAAALATADARAECDVLILCRGGGSIEDLWAFNEEVVARAIDACNLPVICGVGHETDFTIADFVADVRAPTPTAAAQLACPNCVDLRERAVQLYHRFKRVMERALERRMQHVDGLARRLVHPGERIASQLRDIAQLGRPVAQRVGACGRRPAVAIARLGPAPARSRPRRGCAGYTTGRAGAPARKRCAHHRLDSADGACQQHGGASCPSQSAVGVRARLQHGRNRRRQGRAREQRGPAKRGRQTHVCSRLGARERQRQGMMRRTAD